MKKVYFLMSLMLMTILSFAQGPNLAKQGGTASVGIPFGGYPNWDWQYIYPASTFNLGTPQAGQITKIYIRTNNSGAVPWVILQSGYHKLHKLKLTVQVHQVIFYHTVMYILQHLHMCLILQQTSGQRLP
jgi:hypothetical protein